MKKKEIDYFSGNHLEVLEKKDVSEEKAEKNQNICLLVSFDVINLQQQKHNMFKTLIVYASILQ